MRTYVCMIEAPSDSAIFAADQCHALKNAVDVHHLAHLGAVERERSWIHDSTPTFEAWLSVRYGYTIEAARDEALLIRTLPSLPKIAEAYGEGLLSRQK